MTGEGMNERRTCPFSIYFLLFCLYPHIPSLFLTFIDGGVRSGEENEK